MHSMGGERRITTIGQAESNFLGIEYVRQVPGLSSDRNGNQPAA